MRNKITILTILILAISNSANLTTATAYHTDDKPVSKMKSEAESHSQKEQRIRFKKGASSATVSGTVENERGRGMIYILRARAGQTIDVKITDGGKNNDVVFYIVAPDDSYPMGDDANSNYDTAWRGKLRKTGDYKIFVDVIESKKANFKMSVAIR